MVTQEAPDTKAAEAAIAALREALRAVVTTADDASYDAARAVWNGMIDRRPAAIVRAKDTQDVAAAVRVAARHGVTLAVRAGGHNVAGSAVADGAIVVDLREMRGVTVDAQARTVRVQGGATLGEIDTATQEHGLAVPMGVVTETGIAGLTLGGGLGWLRRKHGLSVDNLISAEMVLADGRIVRASAGENGDLFWAIRGGGGNFGVVTEFEFQAHPVGPEVTFLVTFVPLEDGVQGLKFFREYMRTVPDELSSFAIVGGVPDADVFPEPARGRDALIFASCWTGDPGEGERVIEPLRRFATPLVDLSGRWSYLDVQKFFDEDYPTGGRYYWKSQYIDALTDEAIEGIVQAGYRRPSKASTVDLWHLGGAVARVRADATPVPQRQAQYLVGIEANWGAGDTEADAANVAWARELWAATQRWSPAGVYVNFAGFGEEGTDLVRAAYGENYDRLARVKAKYDPANLFHVNQNIKPAP